MVVESITERIPELEIMRALENAIQEAEEARKKAVVLSWAAFNKVAEPARKVYEAAIEPAWHVRLGAEAQAEQEFQEAVALAWKVSEEGTAWLKEEKTND